MKAFRIDLKIYLAFAVIFFVNAHLIAEPAEVATGTLSCNAQWNEFCEDQKNINVPDGHKLCNHTITVTEQSGDSSYQLVSTDARGIVVKFHAKGNGDRFKQQSGSISLKIVLMGVREGSVCTPNETVIKATTPSSAPIPAPEQTVQLPAKTVPPAETKIIETKTEVPAEKPIETPAAPPVLAAQTQKSHACACSKWIDADRVTNCLVNGHARDNATCDSFMASIQCVGSRDECREIQKDDCHEMFGLNQSTSQKRIFVADSPYCQKK